MIVVLFRVESDDAEDVVCKLPGDDDLCVRRTGTSDREHASSPGWKARTAHGTKGRPRTCNKRCEQSNKLPTIQLAYRAHGFNALRLRQSRNTHVNMAPATGHVEAISPRMAASETMKRPEMGHAMAYMDPPPASRAVRTPRTQPVSPKHSDRQLSIPNGRGRVYRSLPVPTDRRNVVD